MRVKVHYGENFMDLQKTSKISTLSYTVLHVKHRHSTII